MYLKARITEQQISFINKDNCKTTFDNFEELESQVNSSLLNEMKDLIAQNKIYDANIISNNGILFKNDDDQTILTALIKDNGVDITSKFEIIWYAQDGEILSKEKELLVKSSDFIDKKTYYFDGYINNSVKATCEVTCINLRDGKDAIVLHVSSSNGTSFKNSDISTTFTVSIIVGDKRIENSNDMYNVFGKNARIIWKVKRMNENEFKELLSTDERISDNGFILTITTRDVYIKSTFTCDFDY